MDEAWPASDGEAIHTSTYLGNPVGCAMALAQLKEIERLGLVAKARNLGAWFTKWLRLQLPGIGGVDFEVRGSGLMLGLELRQNGKPATAFSLECVKRMLAAGYILLPEGEHAEVISFTPPLTISERQLKQMGRELIRILTEVCAE